MYHPHPSLRQQDSDCLVSRSAQLPHSHSELECLVTAMSAVQAKAKVI